MKRPDHAIAAFEKARSVMGPNMELHIVGSGPLEEELRRKAIPGVVIHGRVSQLEKFRIMASAHALLATSVREGWGLVVSEAAAVGTAAIAYDIAGLRDSVAAADGFLSAENPDALAAAIVKHLPNLVRQPRAPIAHGGAHSWDHVAADVLERIERVAKGGPFASTHSNSTNRSEQVQRTSNDLARAARVRLSDGVGS